MAYTREEMAHRLLTEFDALDKYSQEIMAKHAKKRSLGYMQMLNSLKIPLLLNFDVEHDKTIDEADNLETISDMEEDKHNIFHRPMRSYVLTSAPLRKPDTTFAMRVRPFTAPGPSNCQQCEQEENGNLLLMHEDTNKLETHTLQNKNMGDNISYLKSDEQNTSKQKKYHHTDRDFLQESQIIINSETVPLSMEDEMKKPNVKIIPIRQQKEAAQAQNVSETHPLIYSSNSKYSLHNMWSDLHKEFVTKQNYLSNSQSQASNHGNVIEVSSVLQSNLDYARKLMQNKQPTWRNATVKKNEKTNAFLSTNKKLNIHFLSANGTKQKLELAKDSTTPKIKDLNIHGPSEASVQKIKPTSRSVSSCEMKQDPSQVGPVINGVNPINVVQEESFSYTKSPTRAKSFSSNGSRAALHSQVQRPNSVGEIQNLSYISISKPLTPPECNVISSLRSSSAQVTLSEVTNDGVGPVLRKNIEHFTSPVALTIRPGIFESSKGRHGSVLTEMQSFQPDCMLQISSEKLDEVKKQKECGEIVPSNSARNSPCTLTVTEHSAVEPIAHFNLSVNEEDREMSSSIPTYLSTFPVISIPTAQADSPE